MSTNTDVNMATATLHYWVNSNVSTMGGVSGSWKVAEIGACVFMAQATVLWGAVQEYRVERLRTPRKPVAYGTVIWYKRPLLVM